MPRKVIWIINQYASTPEVGMGGRHFYLARELVKQGYVVYVVTASFTHLHRTPVNVEKKYLKECVDGVNYVWLGMPTYTESHSKQRIINWFLFAWRLASLKNVIKDKPNAIMYSSPSLIGYLGAKVLAKKLGCKLAFEARDIWPMTLIKLGRFSSKHPFIVFMAWVEKYAYKSADLVLSNLGNAIKHMAAKGMDERKFSWIPNGVSLDEVENPEPLSLKIEQQLPKDKFIVGYTGTLGVANALEYFVSAAEIIKDNSNIVFVLVGTGKEHLSLKNSVYAKKLTNVCFIEPVRKNQVQSLLKYFDVCYIGWRDEEMYEFGIAPNKLPEYMYAKKPIIHSFSGEGDYVLESGAGLTVPAESPSQIADAISELYAMTNEERLVMGLKGHRFVLDKLNYTNLATDLADVLL